MLRTVSVNASLLTTHTVATAWTATSGMPMVEVSQLTIMPGRRLLYARRRTTVALGVGHMTGRAKSRIGTPPLKESVEESSSESGPYTPGGYHLPCVCSMV